jgi:hypothetical protein
MANTARMTKEEKIELLSENTQWRTRLKNGRLTQVNLEDKQVPESGVHRTLAGFPFLP